MGWRALVLVYYVVLFKLVAVLRLYTMAAVTLPKPDKVPASSKSSSVAPELIA